MANFINSLNMVLPIPVVGVDPGPDYAQNINNSLTLIDQHDHSPGYGVAITPAGLNISSDLSFNNNNLTMARSLRLSPQLSPIGGSADLGCLYEAGVDLYYNDGLGNQIRLTQSGGVAGTSGSIANLVSPASATYVGVSQTFVFQSAANTPGNIDGASFVFRNLSANSKGLTLSPPSAMAADYSITLPTLPGSTKILTMTSAGVIGSVLDVDNSTIEIAANAIQIKDKGVTQIKLADRSMGTTVAAGGVAISASSGVQTVNGNAFADFGNLSVTITTTGRPVAVFFQADGSGNSQITLTGSSVSTQAYVRLINGSTSIGTYALSIVAVGATSFSNGIPASSVYMIDFPAAGTYTYKAAGAVAVPGEVLRIDSIKLVAYEI